MTESWILSIKYEEIKNWDAVEDIIKHNQWRIDLRPYDLEEKERLLAEIEHLRELRKQHEQNL